MAGMTKALRKSEGSHPKRLYLLRHAKAARPAPGQEDHERPLSTRGREASRMLGDYCRENAIRPTLVLCSTAERTRETLALVRTGFGEVRTKYDKRIYLSGSAGVLGILRGVGDNERRVMVIGHNPDLHHLVLTLASEDRGRMLRRATESFPTGALATLELRVPSWEDLGPGTCRFIDFAVPREFD
jgi:phosphohistidine phosphatase